MSGPYIFHVVCFKIVKEARKEILREREKNESEGEKTRLIKRET